MDDAWPYDRARLARVMPVAVLFLAGLWNFAVSGGEPGEIWRLPPVEDRHTLRLDEVEQLALVHNPSLARAAADVDAARGAWVQSGKWRNPTVSIGQYQTGSGGELEQDGVTVSQEFVRGGKRRLDQAVATAEVDQAEQHLAAQQMRVLTDVRIAFHDALVAQRQQNLAANLVAIAEQQAADAQQRSLRGEGDRRSVLAAQLELASARGQVRKSAHRQIAAWQAFGAVIGLRDFPPRELDGDLDRQTAEHDFSQTLDRLLTASPELAAAAAAIESRRQALARAAAEKVPNVTFDGTYNWRDNSIGGRPDGGFYFTFPLAVWDRNQGEVAQRRGEVRSAEHALQQLELDLQSRLAAVYERYANARDQVSQYRTAIFPAAEESLALTRQLHQAGQVGLDELLAAQRSQVQAQLDYLDALRELWAAEAELSGMLLTGSLARAE